MIVLGIESSCDDLSMAVLQEGHLLSNVTASQVADHQPFGGVVPEIASRRHLEALELTLESALAQAGLALQDIQGIGATFAPGLVGSLLVGLQFAKGLAFSLEIPFRGVHHIEAHLFSPFLEHPLAFPYLGLIVSGGHTHLFWVEGVGKFSLLGHTVDDAAGEAFDKVAKMMGLPYPGGPAIDRLSDQGNPQAFEFALPRVKAGAMHTSFSGMKTAAVEYWESVAGGRTADLAASFQHGVVRALTRMVERGWEEKGDVPLALAGGVACNRALRRALQEQTEKRGLPLLVPSPKYCTDNGAMIAWLAWQYLKRGDTSPLSLNAQARLPIGT
jgi:N6-L-threonylcarbamoyladenine synthase